MKYQSVSSVAAALFLSCAPPAPGDEKAEQVAESGSELAATQPKDEARRDEVIYFLMADRFDNGDPSNDYGEYRATPGTDPSDPSQVAQHGLVRDDAAYFHGGDLKGLQRRLPYIKELGANAIWTSPLMKNRPTNGDGHSANYHGYAVTDFLAVDPHFGDSKAMKAYTRRAHELGMHVYLDALINHTANVFGYAQCNGGGCGYVSKASSPYSTLDESTQQRSSFDDQDYAFAYSTGGVFPPLDSASFPLTPVALAGQENIRNPAWLNDPRSYHNRGGRSGLAESETQGELFDLDDLFTLHPTVLGGLVDVYSQWIRDYKIDGYRLDAARHVELEFHKQWYPAVEAAARQAGRPGFFAFGEVFSLDAEEKGHYVRQGGLPAVLDFGFHSAATRVISGGAATEALAKVFENDDYYIDADSNAYTLPTFVSNHDVGRFGAVVVRDNPGASKEELLARSALAHALMFTARGIPVVYYGDEQGFTGVRPDGDVSSEAARQDMFPSQVPEYGDPVQNGQLGSSGTPAGDNFDKQHPLYRTIRGLAALRQDVRALRRGAQLARYASDSVFAFSRIEMGENREYLVAFNSHPSETRTASISTLHKSTRFEPVNGDEGCFKGQGKRPTDPTSDANGMVTVSLAPLSFTVLRAKEKLPKRRSAPTVAITGPSHGFGYNEFWIEAGLSEQTFAAVDFYARTADGVSQFLGSDDNAPYRVRFDGSKLAVGENVQVWAKVRDYSGNLRQSAEASVRIENRLEQIRLHYENGNLRSGVFTAFPSGEVTLPRELVGSTHSFTWPADAERLTFFFESTNAQGTATGFDLPFELTLSDVIARARLTATGLTADLYLNDDHVLSDAPNGNGAGTPTTIALDPSSPDPVGVPLYLRGQMNDWGTSQALPYAGSNTFGGRTRFPAAGRYEFKIADASWNGASNFGGPFGADGISVGPFTDNLAVRIDNAGTYDMQMFVVPGNASPYRFYRLSPSKSVGPDGPYGALYLRGTSPVMGCLDAWSAPEATRLSYDEIAQTLSVSISVSADCLATHTDPWQFKLASQDWATQITGTSGTWPPASDNQIQIGSEIALGFGQQVLFVDAADSMAGTYTFIVDVSDPTAPTLRADREAVDLDGPYGALYLRGSSPVMGCLDAWSAPAATRFVYDNLSQELRVTIDVSADCLAGNGDSWIFKLASEDWSTQLTGLSNVWPPPLENRALVNGSATPLGFGQQVLYVDAADVAAGSYTYVVDLSDASAPSLRIEH